MNIFQSTLKDFKTVYDIECRAFGEEEEARLVSDLLNDPSAEPRLSLLAARNGENIGHILFTAAHVVGGGASPSASLLAPLAVVPEAQGEGVGQALIREGLKRLKAQEVELVFVLGHPGYYPRTGFQPAGRLGFAAPYPIPEKDADAWMVQELVKGALEKYEGAVRCADMLNRPEYWRE